MASKLYLSLYGIQSTYILTEGLTFLGGDVDYDIPNRMKDGYGINVHLIERAVEAGIDTIVTCDNGIAAAEEVAYAKKKGITMIVTDHHEVPFVETEEERTYILPKADAVVDPKRQDCLYPFKGLCGAGVAYKLIEALVEAMGEEIDELDYLIENVAIATVCDVMDLVGENRVFVKQGLEMLRRTKNLGLKALINCNSIDPNNISAYHLGFVLGPCMNASGRLDTAKRALQMLKAEEKKEADELALDLKELNDSRKDMTAKALEEAIEQVETTQIKKDDVLVIYLPDCHESLAGIVAGKVREKYYKPVFVLTDAEDGLKGSGRSIEGWHMYEGMNRCANLMTKFGGHKMAAGLSIKKENLDEFRKEINKTSGITKEDLIEKVSIDMRLPFSCVTDKFVKELQILEPFGKANPKPVFAESGVKVHQLRVLGKNKNVVKMKLEDSHGTTIDGIYFGDADSLLKCIEDKYGREALDVCMGRGRYGAYRHMTTNIEMAFTFYPDINEYQGTRTPQIVIGNFK